MGDYELNTYITNIARADKRGYGAVRFNTELCSDECVRNLQRWAENDGYISRVGMGGLIVYIRNAR